MVGEADEHGAWTLGELQDRHCVGASVRNRLSVIDTYMKGTSCISIPHTSETASRATFVDYVGFTSYR